MTALSGTSNSIGILHPGVMGQALAAGLVEAGHEVWWCGVGRSAATRQRAEATGLREAPSLKALCAACDTLISICPPAFAFGTALVVARHGFRGRYVDCNATSPATMDHIRSMLEGQGIAVVDGAVLGGVPAQRGDSLLLLSGAAAADTAAFFEGSRWETLLLGDTVGSASALKLCMSAYMKGKAALVCATVAAAEKHAVRDALEQVWPRFSPSPVASIYARAAKAAPKAWRFTGEMAEVAAMFRASGLPAGAAEAAVEVFGRMARFKGAEPPAMDDMVAALIEGA